MRTTALLAALAALPTLTLANDGLSTDLSLSYQSKYIWRGISANQEGVLQPSLTFGWNGWGANLWGNFDLTDANLYFGTSTGLRRITEWDSSLYYTVNTGRATATLGVTHYDFPNTGFRSTSELWGVFAANMPGSPTLSVYYDFDEAEGIYARLSGSHTLENTGFGSVNLTGWVGYGDRGFNSYYCSNAAAALADYGFEAKLNIPAGDKFTAWIQAGYYGLLDSNQLSGAPNRTNFTFGAGVGTRF